MPILVGRPCMLLRIFCKPAPARSARSTMARASQATPVCCTPYAADIRARWAEAILTHPLCPLQVSEITCHASTLATLRASPVAGTSTSSTEQRLSLPSATQPSRHMACARSLVDTLHRQVAQQLAVQRLDTPWQSKPPQRVP